MRLSSVGHLITHAGLQDETPAIAKLGQQFAIDTKQEVAFAAPMIRPISGRVFKHANSDVAELERAPIGPTTLAGFALGRDRLPVRNSESDVLDFHNQFSRVPSIAADVNACDAKGAERVRTMGLGFAA